MEQLAAKAHPGFKGQAWKQRIVRIPTYRRTFVVSEVMLRRVTNRKKVDPSHSVAAGKGIHDDMFFVGIQIQNRWSWAMNDTSASKNLVSTKFLSKLLQQPDLRLPGAMHIVAINGATLDPRGWTMLIVSIDGH